jgi:hypothetical protein
VPSGRRRILLEGHIEGTMVDLARAQWQCDLLFLESWSQHEFLCALCGRDLDPGERDVARQLAAGDP